MIKRLQTITTKKYRMRYVGALESLFSIKFGRLQFAFDIIEITNKNH